MAVPQKKLREAVFQMLYSLDLGEGEVEECVNLLSKELKIAKSAMQEVKTRVLAIREKQGEIDETISNASESYDFKRIHSVERNVLRLGVYELFYDDKIPPKVAIAEAIRLAKKFGSPEALTFVNALLDAMYKESE